MRTGIWKVIRGWLDPVVAAKVHFTNNLKELEEYIAAERIPKELDGPEAWEYKYVEPAPGENDRMADTEARDKVTAEREELVRGFETATLDWIRASARAGFEREKAAEAKTAREALAAKLRENYWRLDPYIRARSLYDRKNMLKPDGSIEYYPDSKKGGPAEQEVVAEKVAATTNMVPAPVETSADDVD